MADKVIIEVNTRIPSFEGLHDMVMGCKPPHRKPYLIMNTEDRIGTVCIKIWIGEDFELSGWGSIYQKENTPNFPRMNYHFQTALPIDQDKIIAVVESDRPDNTGPNSPADATSEAIASHLIEFLTHEVKMGRLPENLLPLQSGIGNIANAVIGGLAKSPFKDVTV